MRRLVLKMSISVDGFVCGPKGEIDWLFDKPDEAATAWTMDQLWSAGLHIMGARTFADMASYWPYSDENYAAPMNAIPKAVFTRHRPENLDRSAVSQAFRDASHARPHAGGAEKTAAPDVLKSWTEAYVATGPLTDEIAKLKQQPGKDILAHGGADFARSLIAASLVDEYRLLIHPVVLGMGLAIFSNLPVPLTLKTMDTALFAGGAMARVYRPA